MNAREKTRIAAGENDEGAPTPAGSGLSASDAVSKDRSYSPASEAETAQKQEGGLADTVDDDIDPDQVPVAPGTGGPDDVGEIDVDPGELHLPGR